MAEVDANANYIAQVKRIFSQKIANSSNSREKDCLLLTLGYVSAVLFGRMLLENSMENKIFIQLASHVGNKISFAMIEQLANKSIDTETSLFLTDYFNIASTMLAPLINQDGNDPSSNSVPDSSSIATVVDDQIFILLRSLQGMVSQGIFSSVLALSNTGTSGGGSFSCSATHDDIPAPVRQVLIAIQDNVLRVRDGIFSVIETNSDVNNVALAIDLITKSCIAGIRSTGTVILYNSSQC
jgi:hypothetical protein